MSVILKADLQFKEQNKTHRPFELNVKLYLYCIWKKNFRTQIIIQKETNEIAFQCQVENGNDLIWYTDSLSVSLILEFKPANSSSKLYWQK